MFIRGGLPEDRIRIKPNFVRDPGRAEGKRAGLLYVGRLSPEKGIKTLAQALLMVPNVSCDVIGEGPEDTELARCPNVTMHGRLAPEAVLERMKASAGLIMPSIWYENCPRALIEAFACGLPVIASRIGAMATLVKDGKTGLLVEPGNARDLSAKMSWIQAHRDKAAKLGAEARQEYERCYTPSQNLATLLAVYDEAIREHRQNPAICEGA
jgi:glycosyltransferase involved in cell wall biosynthesis